MEYPCIFYWNSERRMAPAISSILKEEKKMSALSNIYESLVSFPETKLNKLCICWDYSLKNIEQIASIVWFQ